MTRILLLWLVFISVACTSTRELSRESEVQLLEEHLTKLTKTEPARNYQNLQVLNSVAAYIHADLSKYCDTVYYQKYLVEGVEYKNVVGLIRGQQNERVVVGAHYDVAGNQQGADDNASGVTGLLELARILEKEELIYTVELVAYTLEEPPFFRTEYMGSFIHAKSLVESGAKVKGMICLEMIGFFSDEKGSQDYPLPHKVAIYGSKGDYIMIVQRFGDGDFGDDIKSLMKSNKQIETKSIKAPSSLPGIDFSDHLNYWKYDIPAIMVTNTAFYRNKNYHKTSDTMEILDLEKMSAVINEVGYAIINLK